MSKNGTYTAEKWLQNVFFFSFEMQVRRPELQNHVAYHRKQINKRSVTVCTAGRRGHGEAKIRGEPGDGPEGRAGAWAELPWLRVGRKTQSQGSVPYSSVLCCTAGQPTCQTLAGIS